MVIVNFEMWQAYFRLRLALTLAASQINQIQLSNSNVAFAVISNLEGKAHQMYIELASQLSMVMIKIACDLELSSFIFVALEENTTKSIIIPNRPVTITDIHDFLDFCDTFRQHCRQVL